MSVPSSEPRSIPRFVSCLVKGPLGCLSFALGLGLVLVLLLPPVAGRVLDRTLERSFAEHHAGELELSDAWLGSLYGPQRVERLTLRDPSGDEVLRARLEAPALVQVWNDPRHHYGPVRLTIEVLRLIEQEDGSTNLERALRALPSELEEPAGRSGLSTDVPFTILLEIAIERLRYAGVGGKEAVLEGLDFRGTLEWGPEATHLVLEGGMAGASPPAAGASGAGGLHARIELERPEVGARRAWKSSLACEDMPGLLARALCAAARPLVPLTGARIDHLSWSRDGNEVALLCADEGARFELLGQDEDGLVSAAAGSLLRASIPCASAPGAALLASLLPLVQSLACVDASRTHELLLADFRWPLDGDWSALGGTLTLMLAPSRCALDPVLPAATGLAHQALLDAPETRFPIHAGVLEYAAYRYPLEQGWVQVDGTLELASGVRDLEVTSASGGAPPESRHLIGTREALVGAPPEPPRLPAEPPKPGAELPVPPGQDG